MSPRLARIWFAFILAATGCTSQVSLGAGAKTAARPAPPPTAHAEASVSVEVRIDFFGIPLDHKDELVFVLDRSGSMGGIATGFSGQDVGMSHTEATLTALGGTIANAVAGGPLPSKMDVAKAELIDALERLPDGTRIGVIFFDSDVATLTRHMVTLSAQTRADMIAFVSGIEPGGSTAAVPALGLAYTMRPRHVVLLSDGLANSGGDGDDLLRDARAQIAHGVRFDTVGIGLDQDAELLRTLAEESGGQTVMR